MAEFRPEINPNPRLQSYYASLESVLGYDLLLGGTRHFGYYEDPKSYNPFPLSGSLRRMEEQLFQALHVSSSNSSARVLDAGCGNGHVARYMARKGLRVTGIDVVERHVRKARKTAGKLVKEREKKEKKGKKGKKKGGEEEVVGSLEVSHMDYHHLDAFQDASFDAVYTMETFVHATDPERVLAGFFRVLKPGGRLAMHEYDNVLEETERAEASGQSTSIPNSVSTSTSSAQNSRDRENSQSQNEKTKTKTKTPSTGLRRAMRQVNEWSAMPTNAASSPGALQRMLEEAGFVDVRVRDLSDHIRPMTRFFYVLAIVPFWIISLLRLERYFINTVAGVGAYRGYGFWRYVQIEARKPGVGALVEES
ncbi:S-adenosyl-L-methionine-dependent methyltransferase [Xylaria sp. FL1042]|nr:S-adenosyl-L-methionine-dependent methyltransferase [Xylaria sp. FL1042]